jgi:hypothetical protein
MKISDNKNIQVLLLILVLLFILLPGLVLICFIIIRFIQIKPGKTEWIALLNRLRIGLMTMSLIYLSTKLSKFQMNRSKTENEKDPEFFNVDSIIALSLLIATLLSYAIIKDPGVMVLVKLSIVVFLFGFISYRIKPFRKIIDRTFREFK